MKLRVLIVDDDAKLRFALSKALHRRGHEVWERPGDAGVLEVLCTGIIEEQEAPLDVCVADLRMPYLTGMEILRHTPQRAIPVVVLTGHGTIDDAVAAMRLGASHFLQKPVDATELEPTLIQVVTEWRRNHTDKVTTSVPEKNDRIAAIDSEHMVYKAGEPIKMEDLERQHILKLLESTQNVSEVARIVGMDRRTLQRKMAQWQYISDLK
jgi:DNA-binding NtrC family response regulator